VERELEQVLQARQRFEEACLALRPDLHRFCTRMTGSVTDGEDLLQEALVHAFYHLPELRQGASLRSWLFRIAHNCCIDWQRRRRALVALDDDAPDSADVALGLEQQELASTALAAIFTQLPPRERASIALRDVLGYSLEETAEVTGTNVGAVKAAIHRGRQKLAAAVKTRAPISMSADHRALIEEYAARFNRRDWEGVRALLTQDARLEVVGRTAGPFRGQYFTNYAKLGWEYRLGVADVEGVPSLVHYRREGEVFRPHAVIVLELRDGRVSAVRDYIHVADLLNGARTSPL
jgi:RNA polymerase sigma-70 factor (ECF subfamily)